MFLQEIPDCAEVVSAEGRTDGQVDVDVRNWVQAMGESLPGGQAQSPGDHEEFLNVQATGDFHVSFLFSLTQFRRSNN